MLELLPNKSAEDERIRTEAGKVMALWSEGEAWDRKYLLETSAALVPFAHTG